MSDLKTIQQIPVKILEMPIDYLGLSTRSHNRFARCFKNVGEVLEYTFLDLLEIRGVGIVKAKEIEIALKAKGLRLKDE